MVVPALERAGVTSFHVALANHSSLEDTIPPASHPYFGGEGCFLPYCDLVRQYTRLPICGVGGLTRPDFVEEQLAQGRIDCAAMSRQPVSYTHLQQRKDHPKGIWTKAVAGARNLCAMAMPMIQMMMARELRGFVPDAELNPIVQENLDLFFRRHVDRERKCVFERVLPDGGHLFDVMEGRLLNPGHALENLWFIMDVANDMGRRDMVDDVAEIMLWVVERGWDKEYGGLFYYQDYMGYPTDKLESQMKLWWVHAEAINAFLLAHKLTGRPEHLEWFKRLHDYSFEHFSDHEYGEWYGYLDREGRPVFGLKGGKWKGFFHLPRMLMVCERWLNEMAEQ